jgi:uncharacterized protein involved in exopolysaccharide biosynthesis
VSKKGVTDLDEIIQLERQLAELDREVNQLEFKLLTKAGDENQQRTDLAAQVETL